jgi:lytic murein transglycosylase
VNRFALAILLLAATLAGCKSQQDVPTSTGASTVPANAPVAAPAPRPTFEVWLAELRVEALAQGVSPPIFDRAFSGVRPNDEVLANERSQPEFTRAIWDYLSRAVSDSRIETGRQRLAENRPTLTLVEQRYGVPAPYVVAIWGIESNFGGNTGGFNVIEALATLAWGSERPDFFRPHLIDALLILEAGDIPPAQMLGSWAGAMGQTQFMPTAFRDRAVDQDGDGRRDIWGSLPDVFGSTAHYLSSYGWKRGVAWGEEVRLPPTFPWDQAELDIKKPVAEWAGLGVRRIDGGALPASAEPASILLPAGWRGPAFLITDNFRTILKYNNATSYALAVSLLADRIAGGGPVRAAWPVDERPLTPDERRELQTLLTAQGYDTAGVDGRIGPKTRAAIRAFQREIGEPPDGFPTDDLLARLRAAAVS